MRSCGEPGYITPRAMLDSGHPGHGRRTLTVPRSSTLDEEDEHGHTDPGSQGEDAEAPSLVLRLRQEMGRADVQQGPSRQREQDPSVGGSIPSTSG